MSVAFISWSRKSKICSVLTSGLMPVRKSMKKYRILLLYIGEVKWNINNLTTKHKISQMRGYIFCKYIFSGKIRRASWFQTNLGSWDVHAPLSRVKIRGLLANFCRISSLHSTLSFNAEYMKNCQILHYEGELGGKQEEGRLRENMMYGYNFSIEVTAYLLGSNRSIISISLSVEALVWSCNTLINSGSSGSWMSG